MRKGRYKKTCIAYFSVLYNITENKQKSEPDTWETFLVRIENTPKNKLLFIFSLYIYFEMTSKLI